MPEKIRISNLSVSLRRGAPFRNSFLEDVAVAWLESLGYAVKHGPDITPGGDILTPTLSHGERESYSQVVLAD